MEHQTLYGPRAELYDLIYHWKNYGTDAERLHALLSAEGIADGASVLEAACGTGSYLRQLSAWYRVSGFDLNEEVLAVARRKLPDVTLWRADMTDFTVQTPADAMLCLFSSIGYVHPEERLRKAARSFARAVRPGGVLIVEPWLTEATYRLGNMDLQTYSGPELKLCRASVAKKRDAMAVLHFHWLVLRKGAPEIEHFEETHELWLCPTETLLSAFGEAGFEVRLEPDGLMPGRGLILGRRKAW
jgi:daunosaminyl-N,N-dimethyltransferase/N-dimethyltransferase